MQQRSGSTLKGVITISLMVLNVIVLGADAAHRGAGSSSLRADRRLAPLRRAARMTALAEGWIGTNNAIFRADGRAAARRARARGPVDRASGTSCVSNHRSWVDILVLQAVFNRRIPFLKFFLKQQLIWVPFLGLAWWALDFPFMRRHSADVPRRSTPRSAARTSTVTRQRLREVPR